LNDPFVHRAAEKLTERLLQEKTDDAARIDRAFRLLFSREPAPNEVAHAQKHIAAAKELLTKSAASAEKATVAAWQSYVRALLLSNEFVYLD
jgi:hypothetical protein